jgi:dTDP-4-amino-4,6-dideoxygalactose transaminase
MIHIPPFKYSFDEEDAAHVAQSVSRLLSSGRFLTLGQHNEEFEELFRKAHGARYAVSVSSGTAALEILLRAADTAGRRVILPSNTYGATAVAVLRAGGLPMLAECGLDLSLDPAHVERLLGPDVAAVITVHIGGMMSASLPRLCAICARHGIPLIEDAAHAAGSALDGRPAGTWGLGGAFSFFSTKVVTCGEGGMIVTADTRVRDLARLLRDHAKRADGGMDVVGYNWRLSEMQAILGVAQMKKLPLILTKRREVAERYARALRGLAPVSLITPAHASAPNYYKQIVMIPSALREPVRRRLREEFDVSLGGEVYAVPCHAQPAFQAYAEGPLPVTDRLCASHICPPIYPSMSEEEMEWACAALRTVLTDAFDTCPGATREGVFPA